MSLISQYKNKNILSPGLVSIYTSKTILLVASGFAGLFVPVFLIQQYHSLKLAILYYLIAWTAYMFLVAPGAKIMNFFGVRKSMIYSLPFLMVFYLSLYFFPNDVLAWSVVSLASITIYRMLYWVPYNVELAKFSETKNRGKQLALLDSASTLLGIIVPLISGFLVSQFGFGMLFVVVIILIIVSMIPLRFVPPVGERFSWSYGRTWKEFFARKNRQMMLAYVGYGAENWVGDVLWPIFIWQLLQGQYLVVGGLTSLITLIAVVLKLVMGDYTDKLDKKKLVRAGSVLYSIGWLVKIFITTAFQIFIASTYHSFALILLKTPFNALIYESTADSGHYIDEYTTLREMYQQLGRIFVISTTLILINFVSLNLVFAVAAVASLLFNLLPKHGFYEKPLNL